MSQDVQHGRAGAPPAPYAGPPSWAPVRPTNTKAILAVSLVSVAPAAIIFGALARREIRRTGEGGWGLATWGMWIGIAFVALYALYFAAIIGLYVVFAGVLAAGGLAGSGGAAGSVFP